MDLLDRFIAGSSSAAVGALSAYLFNKYHWVNQTKKDSILAMELDLIKTIEDLTEDSILYWSDDQINLDNNKLLEAKIKMNCKNLDPQFKQLMYLSGTFSSGDVFTINERINKVFDASTGGDFESSRRTSSPTTCMKIINSCHKIRALIRHNVHS
jgi:hypothetical protein